MPQWNSSHVGVFCALFDGQWPHARATDLVALDLPCGELPQEEFTTMATSIPSFFHLSVLLSQCFWIVVNFPNRFWT